MTDLRDAVAGLPAIDQHAHVLSAVGQEPPLARVLTESEDPEQIDQVAHHPAHHRAVRELCAFAGVADGDEIALAAERDRRGAAAWRRGLLADCGFSAILVDDGFGFPGSAGVGDLADLVDCPVHRIVRLETVVESRAASTFDDAVAGFRAALQSALDEGAVAFKTIAAYRGGLDLPAPDRARAAKAWEAWVDGGPAGGARTLRPARLVDPVLVSWFVHDAIEVARPGSVPLQVHTGMGDVDLRLEGADPLLLRPVIERAGSDVPVVLLHCYPFVAHASCLAGLYANVYLDVSLAMTLVSHLGPDLVMEALGQAPATKLLFATDASRLAEGYYLGARWWRDSLARALGALVDSGHITEATALDWAALILSGNARRLYRL